MFARNMEMKSQINVAEGVDVAEFPLHTTMSYRDSTSSNPGPGTSESSEIQSLRAGHETEIQWQFRKNFILRYQDRHLVDQLQCWSKILSNMKYYGCR